MIHAELVPVRPEHVDAILASMREQEASAIDALGRDPRTMLEYELRSSYFTYSWVVGDETVVVGGLKQANIFVDDVYAWIICSEAVNRFPTTFARYARKMFVASMKRFPNVYGYVVTDFERSVRWVTWLGFTVEPAVNGVALFWRGKRPNGR